MVEPGIRERVERDGVKFVSLQFTDVTGGVKSVDVPAHRIPEALESGVWFDGSSVEGFARIQESDMRLVVDPDTYAVLPWSPDGLRRGRVFCYIYRPDGAPFGGDPRGVLRRQLTRLDERGWVFNVGPEPEFFLFRADGSQTVHPVPHDVAGYFDFSSDDAAVRVRTELMAALETMGLTVEAGHHEVALGQHEIDIGYAPAMRTADNVLTLKYTVKAIAARHGLVASFMPKPVAGINGSGMHCHQSIFDAAGNNLFYDPDGEMRLSALARRFIAGQLAHARALAAVVAPTVNSYKRLVPGYEAPVYVGWAQINRSALIRLPRHTPGRESSTRVELRCPDPSANPYLAFAAMLAAGLDGIERQLECPLPLNEINVYELGPAERAELGVAELPGSLADALAELEADDVLKGALGPRVLETFTRAKHAEVAEYGRIVSDWEVGRYLETA